MLSGADLPSVRARFTTTVDRKEFSTSVPVQIGGAKVHEVAVGMNSRSDRLNTGEAGSGISHPLQAETALMYPVLQSVAIEVSNVSVRKRRRRNTRINETKWCRARDRLLHVPYASRLEQQIGATVTVVVDNARAIRIRRRRYKAVDGGIEA